MLEIHGTAAATTYKATAKTAQIMYLTLEVYTCSAIASRLWYMGRQVQGLAGSMSSTTSIQHRYLAPIFIIMESGAISALAEVVAVVVFLTNDGVYSTATIYLMAQLWVSRSQIGKRNEC